MDNFDPMKFRNEYDLLEIAAACFIGFVAAVVIFLITQ